ncbi:MAG: hypothetical protein MR239_06725 [Clostridiales bacterium]|nr:hypothetical protein [Clostridiales bacterium]
MKTEKTMKKIKITAVSIAAALIIVAVALIAVFLPKSKAVNAAENKSEAVQTEQVMTEIEKLEEEYQKAFDETAELWEKYFAEFQKLEEIPEDFDEKTFINGLSVLSDEEKATLIKNVDKLDELDEKLDELYNKLFDADEDALYNGCKDGMCDFSEKDEDYFADTDCSSDETFIETDENFFGDDFGRLCDVAETENDNIQALKKEFDEVMDAHADLWDKVYASYDELDENFDYANFDEAKYISELTVLSSEEKELLLKDIEKLDEISKKLYDICKANCGRW